MSRSLNFNPHRGLVVFGRLIALALALAAMAWYVNDRVVNSSANAEFRAAQANPRPVLGDTLTVDVEYSVERYEAFRDEISGSSLPYYRFFVTDSLGFPLKPVIPVERLDVKIDDGGEPYTPVALMRTHDENGRETYYWF